MSSIFSYEFHDANIYIIVAIILGIIGIGVSNLIPVGEVVVSPYRQDKKSRACLLVVTILLVVFCAFRTIHANSIDEWAYRRRFDSYSLLSLDQVFSETTEYLFALLVWISSRIFASSQGLIIITGTLTAILYTNAIKKLCRNFSLGISLIMLSCVMLYTFNGIQQCLAAGVFLNSIPYITKRELKKCLLVFVICFFIHNSSFFLIVLYFLAYMEFGTARSFVFTILIVISIYLSYYYLPSIIPVTGWFTSYSELIGNHAGVQWTRVVVNFLPVILAFFVKSDVYKNDKLMNFLANITIINFMIYIVALIDTYIARLALFTYPCSIIFVVNAIELSEPKDRRILKPLFFAIYFAMCIYSLSGVRYSFNLSF